VAEVRLRAAAAADLADILHYSIQSFGAEVAEDYVRSFERVFDLLREHPEAGAFRIGIAPPIRCVSHRRHRIYYDMEEGTVWVVRILHHAVDEHRWLTG
jgi:toxin ParE1/3/4